MAELKNQTLWEWDPWKKVMFKKDVGILMDRNLTQGEAPELGNTIYGVTYFTVGAST